MKNNFWLYGAIAIVAISFLYSCFSKDKYEMMTKSKALYALDNFSFNHKIISVEMDDGDYVLIKYR